MSLSNHSEDKKKYFFGIHASRKSEEKSSGRPKHRSARGDAPVNGTITRRPTNDGAALPPPLVPRCRQNARSQERQEVDIISNDVEFLRDRVHYLLAKIDEYKNVVSSLVSEIRAEDGRLKKLYHTKRRQAARLALKLRQLEVVIEDEVEGDDEELEASALLMMATQATEFLDVELEAEVAAHPDL